MNNEYVSVASDSQEEEEQEDPQIRNILVEPSKRSPVKRPLIPSQKAFDPQSKGL